MLEGVRQPDVFHTVHLRPVRGDAFEFQQEHGLQQGGLVSLSLAAFYPLYQVVPATVGVGQNVGHYRRIAVFYRVQYDAVCFVRVHLEASSSGVQACE